MVTPPKPPGSSTLISPPPAVFEMAPAKVLHGAVRLHGFASSPTPETQVRVAWAWADPICKTAKRIPPKMVLKSALFFITCPPMGCLKFDKSRDSQLGTGNEQQEQNCRKPI